MTTNNRAYTYYINPIGSPPGSLPTVGEDNSVHQISPAWVLTFVRWRDRDTERIINDEPLATRALLVVESDCIQVSVSDSKSTLTPNMSAVLLMTDVNYETAVAPGDFVFVNMLNWQSRARDVANQARANTPINGPRDGFKGLFKVQGVRRMEQVDPSTGVKSIVFRINAFAFTEFNNIIYFNPSLLDPAKDPNNQQLFLTSISKDWASLATSKGFFAVQDIIALLIQSFIGSGIDSTNLPTKPGLVTTNTSHFSIPSIVGTLLGVPKAKDAKDVYRYLFGIQQYAAGISGNANLSAGMNPTGLSVPWNGFYYTTSKCDGQTILKPEYWNQIKTWSILNQYLNAPLNEMYTCFRITPDNKVMPTLVVRQIPFTNEDFSQTLINSNFGNFTLETTYFMNIPRWKIHPSLITSIDIGRDEAARINFVQYFGRSSISNTGMDISYENSQGNYMYDKDDVQRSGLRPYIVSTEFEDPSALDKGYYRSPQWAQILGDALIGGHLKLNGTIECAGITAPISVGDNLELDNIVYHIEQISHTASVSPQTGHKSFRTTIALSNGMSTSSSSAGARYPEMYNTSAYAERTRDWNNNKILPGVSEAQDVIYRTGIEQGNRVEPSQQDINQKSSPFLQPGQTDNSGDSNE
jgi:hypothetical protein